jgi:phytoene dehydrogenase-like protein
MYGRDNPVFFDSLDAKRKSLPWLASNLGLFLELRREGTFIGQRLDAYLGSRTRNPDLIRLLCEPFFEGTPMFFGLGYSRLFQDYYYPRGGMQAIPDLLARYIESRGGEIRRSCRIEKIGAEGGKAVRAISSEGEAFEASAFVYAGDMRRLYFGLLDGLPGLETIRERIGASKPAESVFTAYLCLDLPPDGLPSRESHLIHIPRAILGPRQEARKGEGHFRQTSLEISIPCLRDPSLAPPGKTGMILSAAALPEDLGADPSGDRGAYLRRKDRIAADLLANAEALYPGLSARVENSITASPFTMERHTLNSKGAVNGWTADRSRVPVPLDFFKFPAAIETPLPNLKQAGHWVFSPAGAPVAIMSGKLAADAAIAHIRHR